MKLVFVVKDGYERCEGISIALNELKKIAENYFDTVWTEIVFPKDEDNKLKIINKLKTSKVDIIITFDLAGFSYVTALDDLAFNLFEAHKAHLILNNIGKDEEQIALSHRLNFSDIVYLPKDYSLEDYSHDYPDVIFGYLDQENNWTSNFEIIMRELGYENIIF